MDAEWLGFLEDEEVSSRVKLLSRPQGQMIPHLAGGGAVIIAVHDRAFRSAADAEETLEQMQLAGIRCILMNLQVDTATPEGIMIVTYMAAASRWERENILARCRRGMEYKRRRGGVINHAPFGWKIHGRGKEARYVPDLEQRKLGAYCFNRIVTQGWTLKQTSDELMIAKNRGATKSALSLDRVALAAAYHATDYPMLWKPDMIQRYGSDCFKIEGVRRLADRAGRCVLR